MSESPILSIVMTQNTSAECEMLGASNETLGLGAERERSKREAEQGGEDGDQAPNIDFLLNPRKKRQREEYESYIMRRLVNFFEERNSSVLYPNLFRLLWYTKIPCLDLFNLTGDHAHVLKHCEWAGQPVPCGDLFQAIPTDVGICCSFNSNSSMKETIYAKLIRELKQEEMEHTDTSTRDERQIHKGRVGFEMGLKVAIDSHSNIASPATISSDGNAFQVYIGNPGEFPFLRNRAVQIQPGYENHVEVSAIQISADPNIVSHSIADRKCQFYWEGELDFHSDYSYTSCVVEFALAEVLSYINISPPHISMYLFKALRTVECVPWYMPQHGSFPICGPWQTSQFQKIMGRSFSANHTESGCLPDCQSVKYTYTLSQVRVG